MTQVKATSHMFTCNEAYCFVGEVFTTGEPEISDDKLSGSVPFGFDIHEIWLIRSGWTSQGEKFEQEVLDVLDEQKIKAMWVDSESDARAMWGDGLGVSS